MKFEANLILYTLLLLSLGACSNNDNFELKGLLSNTSNDSTPTTLYLDYWDVDGISAVDSVTLSPTQKKFTLKGKQTNSPAYFRLRTENDLFPFVLEPNVAQLQIRIDSASYSFENSEVNAKLTDYLRFENTINDSIRNEVARYGADLKQRDSLETKILSITTAYKDSVRKIVYADPSSPIAYYALFRKLVYGITAFNPTDKKDLQVYSAIATSWHAKYKNTPREKQLYSFVLKARSNIKQEEYDRFFSTATTTNFPDLSFADAKGKIQSLSSLRGKYILLDFCVYSQMSPSDYLLFKNIYEHYHAKGLEIYQISFDSDYEYWKKTVADLPWICVNDVNGFSANTYNITSLPYNYLIDKSGNIIAKNILLDKLDRWIK